MILIFKPISINYFIGYVVDNKQVVKDKKTIFLFKKRNSSKMVNNTIAPITLTPGAVNEIKTLIYEQELGNEYGLRIGVKGGGCSGLSYVLGFDTKQEGDEEFTIEGINVFMNRAHGMYLMGMEIDYLNGLDNRGFMFNNPNANTTCGCGTSFSA